MRNHYAILEIPDFANGSAIKAAYRRMSKMYHPDVNPNYPPAAEMFKRISEAYAVLSDRVQKAAFDQALQKYRGGQAPKGAASDTTGRTAGDDLWDSGFPPLYEQVIDGWDMPLDPSARWRLAAFHKWTYGLDILVGAYILYYRWLLDFSAVPQFYHFMGRGSWLAHLSVACALQAVSIGVSVFQVVRRRKGHGCQWHIILKWMTAFAFIAPMFGMTMFDLPGGPFGLAVVWNTVVGFALFSVISSRP